MSRKGGIEYRTLKNKDWRKPVLLILTYFLSLALKMVGTGELLNVCPRYKNDDVYI